MDFNLLLLHVFQIEAHLDTLINEQASYVLTRAGLSYIYSCVQQHTAEQVEHRPPHHMWMFLRPRAFLSSFHLTDVSLLHMMLLYCCIYVTTPLRLCYSNYTISVFISS